MAKKVSRAISVSILALAIIAVLLALRTPNTTPVSVSAQDAAAFDEKIQSLAQAHQQGISQTAHITEAELNSKLQQAIEGSAASPQGSMAMKAASVHLQGNEFAAVFTLNAYGRDLYLTMTGTLGVADSTLQIQPSSTTLGSLPIPAFAFRSRLQHQLDSPAAHERLQLPEFIKDVRVENSELCVESR